MSKRKIWVCDRCSKQVEVTNVSASSLPPGWKDAVVSDASLDDTRSLSSQTPYSTTKLWCKECWEEIRKVLPTIAEPK